MLQVVSKAEEPVNTVHTGNQHMVFWLQLNHDMNCKGALNTDENFRFDTKLFCDISVRTYLNKENRCCIHEEDTRQTHQSCPHVQEIGETRKMVQK